MDHLVLFQRKSYKILLKNRIYLGVNFLLAEERYQKIISMLESEGSVKVSNLIKLFGVSIETVRRDLEYLEAQGYLKKVYGGAIAENKAIKGNAYTSFTSREIKNINEKHEIASLAIRSVSEDQSLALDSGTTTFEVARELKKNFQRLTILTNSIKIANELADMDKYTIILTGGILKNDEYSLVGDIALDNIGKFNIDCSFISVSGISLNNGFTDWRMDEIQIQRKMMEISKQTMVLADSSKFGEVSLLKICDVNQVDAIITDSNLKTDIYDKYTENGVNIINR